MDSAATLHLVLTELITILSRYTEFTESRIYVAIICLVGTQEDGE